MAKNKDKNQNTDSAEQAQIDERVNAVADKFGAADVEIEDGLTEGSESVIVLFDSEGEEMRRGTLSELEAADPNAEVQKDQTSGSTETNASGKATTDGEPLKNESGDGETAGTTNDPDRTVNVVQDQTLADLKTKFGAAEVELMDGPNGSKESVIILKDDRGNIIQQGIAAELINLKIADDSVLDENGAPRALTSEEVHEQGIGTAVPGANPKPPEPVKVDENDLPKAARTE